MQIAFGYIKSIAKSLLSSCCECLFRKILVDLVSDATLCSDATVSMGLDELQHSF